MDAAAIKKKFFTDRDEDFSKLILSDFATYNGKAVCFVKLTSALAAFWLTLNKDNFRKITQHRVTRYRNSVDKKGWDENCEPIQFAATAKLVNGQHRVTAVAYGNHPIVVLVAFGVKDVLHIDTGKPRSLKENLGRLGHENPGDLAGTAKRIYSFVKTGSLRNDAVITISDNADVIKFINDNKSIEASLSYGRKVATYLPKNHAAALHWVFRNGKDAESTSVDYFFGVMANELKARKDCPVGGLKDQLDADNGRSKLKFGNSERLAMAIKAWNLLVANEKAIRLSWSQAREDFPVPAGWEDAVAELAEAEAVEEGAVV